MALKLITPPADTPVSLNDAKAHLRELSPDFDTTIRLLIQAATQHLDGYHGFLQRALRPQTWELTYDHFPCGAIEIPLPPLIEVLSVKYTDADGLDQTVSSLDYEVDRAGNRGWIVLNSDASWPSTMNTVNALRIRFTAGYPDSEAEANDGVPAPIRQAILMMVADWFKQAESFAEGAVSEVPMAAPVKALLMPYREFV